MSNETALAKIEKAQQGGALVFVEKDWLIEKTPLYKPEISEMSLDKEKDCFNISGKFMPKREVVDRIGEASGIDFVFGEVRTTTLRDALCGERTVYTAVAQGRKMMSDGSYRISSKCDYEFDPVLRGMLDFDVTELNPQTKQKKRLNSNGVEYGSTLARYIMELQKVANQRANTGARLRVIRELVGMPTAFSPKEIEKPLYFGRMVQNTEYILNTSEGRNLATAKALGFDLSQIFGKPSMPPTSAPSEEPSGGQPTDENTKNPVAELEQEKTNTTNLAAQAAAADGEFDFPSDEDLKAQEAEKAEFEKLTVSLEGFMTYKEYLNVNTRNGNPYELAEAELASTSATVETRKSMIKRVRAWLEYKGVRGAA